VERDVYYKGNPIKLPPRKHENPLARISTSSNDANHLCTSLFHSNTSLKKTHFQNCKALFELNSKSRFGLFNTINGFFTEMLCFELRK
jgi:hypothetical protein